KARGSPRLPRPAKPAGPDVRTSPRGAGRPGPSRANGPARTPLGPKTPRGRAWSSAKAPLTGGRGVLLFATLSAATRGVPSAGDGGGGRGRRAASGRAMRLRHGGDGAYARKDHSRGLAAGGLGGAGAGVGLGARRRRRGLGQRLRPGRPSAAPAAGQHAAGGRRPVLLGPVRLLPPDQPPQGPPGGGARLPRRGRIRAVGAAPHARRDSGP